LTTAVALLAVDGWHCLEAITDPLRLAHVATAYGPHLAAAGLTVAAILGAARSALWRWRHARLAEGARLVEVAVPPKVEDGSAAAWWAHQIGLAAPRWKRLLFGQPHLAFEYVADAAGVRILIWIPGTIPPGIIEKTVIACWPGTTVTTGPAVSPIPPASVCVGGRLSVARADHYPLRPDHDADPLRALLGAMSGLAEGQHAAVQVLARPVTGRRLARAHRAASVLRGGRSAMPHGRFFDLITPGTSYRLPAAELPRLFPERAEEVRAILKKASCPRFEVQIRYAVVTSRNGEKQAKGWLRGHAHHIAAAFALHSSGHQFLRRGRLRSPAARLSARRLDRGYLLSVPELAALAHLPYDLDAPGITRAGARPVAPSPTVPTAASPDVRPLGDADGGHPRTVALPVPAARQHLHVLGETGVGKSTFLASLILADAHAGRGALVIDPKGDLVADVLDRLPASAIGKTVVFDPTQKGRPPCVNVLAGTDPAFAVDSIVTIFHRCFTSAWGPRIDDLLRSACLTLTKVDGTKATLTDVPRLLSDSAYRTRIVSRLGDELLRGFWADYDNLTPAARSAVISPVMNKLRAVLLRPFVRDALSGAESTVDLGALLDGGGLILARLPKGVLGEDAARLFGSLLLAHAWQAITPRARRPEHARNDAAIYVDEAHNFLNLPGSLADILAEARAYRLALVLAHQHLSQLPRDLRDAVSADARNKIYFTVSPEDATELAKHVAPLISAHDLSHLGAYQATGRIVVGSQQTPAFTFRTRPLPAVVPGRQEQIRAASRDRFAAKKPPRPTIQRPKTLIDPRSRPSN
jgi:type IV secretion system coupling TraD/TrwB family protein